MQDRYYSDSICQIKRFKGRNKFEIFIHNKDFRRWVEGHEILVYQEDLQQTRKVSKKILSPSFGYARYLQACYAYISRQIASERPHAAIQQQLDHLSNECKDRVRPWDISDEERQVEAFNHCYQLIRARINPASP